MEHTLLEMCHLVQIDIGRFRINKMTCCMKQRNHLAYAKQMKLPIACEFCKYEEPREMDIADVTDSQFACLTFCCMYWTIVWIFADGNLGHLWLRIQCSDAELLYNHQRTPVCLIYRSAQDRRNFYGYKQLQQGVWIIWKIQDNGLTL